MDCVETRKKWGGDGRTFCRAALLLFAFLAVSCAQGNATIGQPSAQATTLTIGLPLQAGQDPLRGATQAARLISREGLTLPSRNGKVQPRLAESWTESPDGLTWRFQLRSNALFHDGTPVDSAAVKASLERSLASSDLDQYPGLADIVAIESTSKSEIVISVRSRSTFLLDDLGVSIVKDASGQPVGTGPYVTVQTSENELAMRAFPGYYRGMPKIQRVLLKAYPTVRTAWAAMMRGEVDFLYEVGQETREFIEGESSVAVFPFLRNYVYAIGLNIKKPAFRDSRIRQALNYAVNREGIVAQAFKGNGISASGGTWPQHWAYNPNVPAYSFDADRASALLHAAGIPEETRASSSTPPGRLHFTCIIPEGFPLWERLSLLVQRDFSRIGIHMALQALPVKEFNVRIMSGDFDAFVSEFIIGNSPSRPFTFWNSTSKQNLWGYSNKAVDQAFAGIRNSQNETEYREAFSGLQTALFQDPPAVFLALGENSRAVSRRFVVVAPPGSDILPTIADWQLAAPDTGMTN